MKLFVGGLPFKYSDKHLKEMFDKFGDITEAVIIQDRMTRRSKGFGFVTFASADSGNKAVEEMNGKELEGRKITVNEAKPMEPRENRGGFSRDNRGNRDRNFRPRRSFN